MNALENKELLRRIYAALADGDSRPFLESLADDFRWVITGSNRWSRTYEGKHAVMTELVAVLRSKLEGRMRVSAERLIAEGDHVVVQARGHNVTRTGVPYENSYCNIFTLRDGKIVEMVEYMDSDLALRVLGEPVAEPA